MSNKKKNNNASDPYKFDITGKLIHDGHKKISSEKSRVQTEVKIRKENNR